jgi:hypothetical protein
MRTGAASDMGTYTYLLLVVAVLQRLSEVVVEVVLPAREGDGVGAVRVLVVACIRGVLYEALPWIAIVDYGFSPSALI